MSIDPMYQLKQGNLTRFRNLIVFSALFALVLQIIIVTYNVSTGYVTVHNPAEFLGRIVYSTILSTILGMFLILPDVFMIRKLNTHTGWGNSLVKRSILEFIFTVITGAVIGALGTTGAHMIHKYREPFQEVLINNILIAIVINVILVTGLEAWFFFRKEKIMKLRAEKLHEELLSVKFEVLKSQINPHFLFNCLNVLSGLIDSDTEKAQDFISAFAKLYHYVLDSIEKPVVTLEEELMFTRSYMYLQKIRHGDHLNYSTDIDSGLLKMLLPPLSLQVALENVFKHNNTSADLDIRIFSENGDILISNIIRKRSSSPISTGVGQRNLLRRYMLICNTRPEFRLSGERYISKLPLIPQN